MQLIENTKDLETLCQDLSTQEFVCVDLEFLREHTYFAKLCLIQISSIQTSAIIDPLADDIDLNPFFALMQNTAVTKVFHSGRQDVEIIYNLSGKTPQPIFDTQIAAAAAGFGDAVSYENLVNHILHISLDKTSRLSDWSKRPLTEAQLQYALSDVTHLAKIYPYLLNYLKENNRLDWIKEDLEVLGDENTYNINPDKMWQRIRHRSHSAFFLTTLRELAAWREKRAMRKNTPRQSLIKDELLLNICAAFPQNKEELAAIRGMKSDIASGKLGDEILEVLQTVKNLDKKDYVNISAVRELPNTNSSLYEILKLLAKVIAQQEKITPHMLSDDDELKLYSNNQEEDTSFKHGWRYEIFGRIAEDVCLGKIALVYDPQSKNFKFVNI